MCLERFELSLGEVVSEPTRSAVGEEGDLAVLESEGLGGLLGGRGFVDGHFLCFSEMVAASVRSQLLGLAEEARVVASVKHFRETFFERGDGSIVGEVGGVFAAIRPFGWDAEGFAHFFRGALGGGHFTEIHVDVATVFHRARSFTGSGGSSVADGLDELTSDAFVGDFLVIDVELEEGHGAFDIDADGAGVDVSGRGHDATDGRAVADVGIGVEDHVGHAG